MTIKKILSDEYYYVRIYDYLEIELPEVKEAVETVGKGDPWCNSTCRDRVRSGDRTCSIFNGGRL